LENLFSGFLNKEEIMKRSEIIVLSAVSLVFILTSLLLKDVFALKNFLLIGLDGAVSGAFAFWWGFKFIKNKTERKQLLLTFSYCAIVLTIAFSIARYNDHQRVNINRSLTGKWMSPPSDPDDANLVLHFLMDDSLTVRVNEIEFHYSYEIDATNQILIKDEDGEIKFNWFITSLNNDQLIIGDKKRVMTFQRQIEY